MMTKINLSSKKIVVRMPNWLGDFIMALPILTDLKNKYSNCHITALCNEPLALLLKNNPYVDDILSYKRDNKSFLNHYNLSNFFKKLKKEEFDFGILLTNSFSSALWFWLAKVENILGYHANLRAPMLTHPIFPPENKKSQHLIKTYKELLVPLEIPISNTEAKFYFDKEDEENAKKMLKKQKVKEGYFLIGINIGAAYGSAKRWPNAKFKDVAKRLVKEKNCYVVFIGEKSSEEEINKITKNMKKTINLAGKTNLTELACIIKSCDLFLTNDSGPMHIASCVKTPVVAIFGSTCPIQTGPTFESEVIKKDVKCAPCFKRECPKDLKCMNQISSREVFEKIVKKLNWNKAW
jgi:heptosyltransferase II